MPPSPTPSRPTRRCAGASGRRRSRLRIEPPDAGAPLIQTARRLPALRFAPGTTYRAALSALVRSVAADGTLPAGAAAAVRVDAPTLEPCQRLPRVRPYRLDPVPARGARGSS